MFNDQKICTRLYHPDGLNLQPTPKQSLTGSLKTIVMFINLLLIEDIKLVHAAIILAQSRLQALSQPVSQHQHRAELDKLFVGRGFSEHIIFSAFIDVELCKFILMCPRETKKTTR